MVLPKYPGGFFTSEDSAVEDGDWVPLPVQPCLDPARSGRPPKGDAVLEQLQALDAKLDALIAQLMVVTGSSLGYAAPAVPPLPLPTAHEAREPDIAACSDGAADPPPKGHEHLDVVPTSELLPAHPLRVVSRSNSPAGLATVVPPASPIPPFTSSSDDACAEGRPRAGIVKGHTVPLERGPSADEAIQTEASESGQDPCAKSRDGVNVESEDVAVFRPNFQSLLTGDICQVLAEEVQFQKLRQRPSAFDSLWMFFTDADSSKAARIFASGLNPIFLLTVVFTMTQAIDPPMLSASTSATVEVAVEVMFALDLVIRIIVCPSHRAFFQDPFNALDVLSIAPLALRFAVGFVLPDDGVDGDLLLARSVLLGAVPVIRLLKCLRRFESFHLILTAFGVAFEALPMLVYILCVIALTSSAIVYYVEPRENIASLPIALWFTLTTMTTVGYGDLYPVTTAGRVIVACLFIVSALYMAIPIGIVGNAFNSVWVDRDRLLLLKRTQIRLVQMGYGAADIPRLFELIGRRTHGSGELYFNEFRRMMKAMRLNMNDDRVHELFQFFDRDGGGTIDDKELMQGLFPTTYLQCIKHDLRGGSAASKKTFDSEAVSAESASLAVSDRSQFK